MLKSLVVLTDLPFTETSDAAASPFASPASSIAAPCEHSTPMCEQKSQPFSHQHCSCDFQNAPNTINQHYNLYRQQCSAQKLSPIDHALTSLQNYANTHNFRLTVITHTISNCYERAGIKNVVHLYGEVFKARCTRTFNITPCSTDITPQTRCLCCNEAGTLRPHIVWRDEIPFGIFDRDDAITASDSLVAMSSLTTLSTKPLPAPDYLNTFNGYKIAIGQQSFKGFNHHIQTTTSAASAKALLKVPDIYNQSLLTAS